MPIDGRSLARIGRGGLALIILATSAPANAGILVSPAAGLGMFSSRPEVDESTPNYYGYRGSLQLGYSAKQIFDMGGFAEYQAGRHNRPALGDEDAAFYGWGGVVALRLGEAIYFGLRGGTYTYKQITGYAAERLPGSWHGPGGALAIGSLHEINKRSTIQFTVEFTTAVVTRQDVPAEGKRRIDSFGIALSYVYNGYKSTLIDDQLFKGFLDSLSFF